MICVADSAVCAIRTAESGCVAPHVVFRRVPHTSVVCGAVVMIRPVLHRFVTYDS
jgi:hypothetical protein